MECVIFKNFQIFKYLKWFFFNKTYTVLLNIVPFLEFVYFGYSVFYNEYSTVECELIGPPQPQAIPQQDVIRFLSGRTRSFKPFSPDPVSSYSTYGSKTSRPGSLLILYIDPSLDPHPLRVKFIFKKCNRPKTKARSSH